MATVTVGAAVSESFRFIRTGWTEAWAVMLVAVGVTAAFQAATALHVGGRGLTLIGDLVGVFTNTAAIGGLYRIGIGPRHGADDAYRAHPGGLQWGQLEWRVLGANIVFGLLIGVLLVAAIIIWALLFGVAEAGNAGEISSLAGDDTQAKLAGLMHLMTGTGGAITVIIWLPVTVALIYIGARLTTFAIGAADAGKFSLGEAWNATNGSVAAIVVVGVLNFLAQVAVAVGADFIGGKPWGSVVGEAVGLAVSLPVSVGLALLVYRTTRGEAAVADAFT